MPKPCEDGEGTCLGDSGDTGTSGAIDPNQKLGPATYGEDHYIAAGTILPYRVDFENLAEAAVPAQIVTITDPLDPRFDWSTFELTGVGFGDQRLDIPPGSQRYEGSVPISYGGVDFEVLVQAGIRLGTGEVYANFYSVDPITGLPPAIDIGFLPPEDGTGRGQGYFSYVIHTDNDLPNGAELRNVAYITFDGAATIATNQIDPHDPDKGTDPEKEAPITLDETPPVSAIDPLPETSPDPALVTWSGSDPDSGVGSYNIYVRDHAVGTWTSWLTRTDVTTGLFDGVPGHSYDFYSIAYDNTGNREDKAARVEASTRLSEAPTDTCEPEPITIQSRTFEAGQYRIASEDGIVTRDGVQLRSGAEVSLRAPTVRFGPGLRVDLGAILKVRAQPVDCGAGTTADSRSARTDDTPADALPEASDPGTLVMPIPVAHAGQLAEWVQILLGGRYAIDLSRAEHLLADADGRWLIFETKEDILPNDRNGVSDVYRFDLVTETLSVLSRTREGQAGNGPSRYPAADALGELVVFESDADDLAEDDRNGVTDIFLHVVALGATTRLTDMATEASAHPAVDAYGSDVLYDRRGEEGQRRILVERLGDGGVPEELSLGEDDAGKRLDNHHPAISADGRFIAYLEARADGSEPGCQVHLFDRDSGRYRRMPCPVAVAAEADAARPYFHDDGRYLEWYLPNSAEPAIVLNPLLDER